MLVDQHPKRDSSSGYLVAVTWSYALASRANHALATVDGLAFVLGHAVHDAVQVETHLRAVADEDAVPYPLETLLFQPGQLFKERRDVHDTAGPNQIVFARRIDQARGEDVEVVGDAVDHDSVARVVAPSGAADQVGGRGEDVDQLAFAFVAPLGAKDECDGHGWEDSRRVLCS